MKKYYPVIVFSLAALAAASLGYQKAYAQELSCEAQATQVEATESRGTRSGVMAGDRVHLRA